MMVSGMCITSAKATAQRGRVMKSTTSRPSVPRKSGGQKRSSAAGARGRLQLAASKRMPPVAQLTVGSRKSALILWKNAAPYTSVVSRRMASASARSSPRRPQSSAAMAPPSM